jgi:two-component system KDP operon response regulator KdpE
MAIGTTNHVTALVVDSEDEDRAHLSSVLDEAGIHVTTVSDGQDALERLRDTAYELLIVALDLEGAVKGLRVAKAARWRWPRTAVILTARHPSIDTAVRGIDLGVDGYVIKPARREKIEETVDAALERQRLRCCVEDERSLLEWEDLSLNRESRRVALSDEEIHLTPTEYRMLLHLMENAHRVIPPEELVKVSRGGEHMAQEAADIARWHIHNLRHKIEPDPSRPEYVVTVHGAGYIFGNMVEP